MKARFPYSPIASPGGESFLAPLLPIELRRGGGQLVQLEGLLDSGASVNVMPYGVGLRLGAIWEEQTVGVSLTGNLGSHQARALIVDGTVPGFPAVRLAFAWSRAENFPLLLGQVNFFQAFDVCFHRARLEFEIEPAPAAPKKT